MLRFHRRRLGHALLLVLCGLAAGCSRSTENNGAASSGAAPPAAGTPPVVGDWVVQRIDSDISTLNPLIGDDANGAPIRGSWVNESMVQMDNYTLQFKPCLATSWEISPDKLTYTFHLRHGVKWHDGQPFTADDVKYTYDKVQDPTTDCPFLRLYFNNIKSCEVLDPYTVRFVASQQYFKTFEELGGMTIVAKHIFAPYANFNENPASRNPVGTGPYKFVRWDTDAQIVLERNPDYWGGTIAYPQRIVYQVIGDDYVAGQLLKKGEIDAFYKVSPLQWMHELEHSPSMAHLHEMVYSYPAYSYIGFNLREPMFQDVRVRHALDLLIPRDRIISEIYLNEYASKTSGYDLPASPSYNHDIAPTPYDPAQALQLLTAAGWKNDHGDGLLYKDGQALSFTLLYPAGNPEREKIAELVQESMRQAGVELKLDRLQFAQLLEHLDDWKFDSCILGWSLDINGDPYQIWHSSQADQKKSSNFIGYKNPAADKLIEEGRLEYDDAKRSALYRQLHQIIHDDYPCCFLFNPREILIVSDRYQNVRTFAPAPCFDISTWWVPQGEQKYR